MNKWIFRSGRLETARPLSLRDRFSVVFSCLAVVVLAFSSTILIDGILGGGILGGGRLEAGEQLHICEIQSSNQSTLRDVDQEFSDWIEVCNLGDADCNLRGYFLTDDIQNLEKWEFPNVTIGAGDYLLVFASEKDRRNPNAELHTNFRLEKNGEPLVLIAPDGQTPIAGFFPEFPPQVLNASYGISTDVQRTTPVDEDSSVRVHVPENGLLGTSWIEPDFNDSTWRSGTQGVGFEGSASGRFDDYFDTDVRSDMHNVNSSIYIRIEFDVNDPNVADALQLRMRYDDGFVAYINGDEVASANAPENPTWDSRASASHSDSRAVNYVDFDITGSRGSLVTGTNVLAIHGFNFSNSSSDFLISSELHLIEVGDIDTENFRHFDEPTPGGPNGAGYEQVSEDVEFSHESGAYGSNISLTMSTPSGGDIRYTTNGTLPTSSSTRYTGPMTVSTTRIIHARSFQEDKLPGRSINHNYIIASSSARNFSSNLPIVIIDTFGSGIGDSVHTNAFVEIIDTEADGRARVTGTPDFTGRGGIKQRGSSSSGFPKKQYALELWDEFGQDRNASLLGMATESDWILYAPYSDKSLMRNFLSYKWSNDIGLWAVDCKFVEVYLKTGSGSLSSSHYNGVYVLMEKIKRDNNRVDIARISRTDNSGSAVTGGYIFKNDRIDPGDQGFNTSRGVSLAFVEPKEREITSQQRSYLLNYINQFETALYGANFRDPVNGFRRFVHTRSWIDHHILVEMTKNIDGYRLSTFFYKDRDDKLESGPIWDYNLSLGNADYLNGWNPSGWYYPQIGGGDYPWWPRMFQDPEFQQEYIDRWTQIRRTALTTANLLADVDATNELLRESQARNFQKWRILGRRVWPNWYIAPTHQAEIDWMKDWIDRRVTWFDSNYPAAPSFTQEGGAIDLPFSVGISSASGTIYYTTDGSDPRLTGGGIHANAIEHGASDSLHLVSESVTDEVRALVPTNDTLGSSWTSPTFNDNSWLRATSGIGVGYERSGSGTYDDHFALDVENRMYDTNTTVYCRWKFDLEDPDAVDFLTLRVKYDDGFKAYLNGQVIAQANTSGFTTWNSSSSAQHDDASAVRYTSFNIDGAEEHLRAGTNVLAIHGMNFTIDSSDLLIVPELAAASVDEGDLIPLVGNTQMKARTRLGNKWSGLSEATFVLNSDMPLRVTEINYHPELLPEGSPFDEEHLEFIEIQNIGPDTIDLRGTAFVEGIQFDFNQSNVFDLPSGEYMILVRNLAAFDWYYGTDGILIGGEFTGRLDNSGEPISIMDGRGELVQLFRFEDTWHPTTDGGGFSLHIIDSGLAKETWDLANSWEPSRERGGSPGRADDTDVTPSGWQLNGDANQDGLLDVSDAVRLLRRLFTENGGELPCEGVTVNEGNNVAVFDTNGDGNVDLSDSLFTLAYLFTNGPAPRGGANCIRLVGCVNACTP